MQVHRDLAHLPEFNNAVITIGTFDGVHSGHQKIIDQLTAEAAACKGESIIITFNPHPREVLHPNDHNVKLLNTLEEKTELLAQKNIDNLVVVPFTTEFSNISAKDYIEDFLISNFHPHTIIIGYDHKFGHHRAGDIHLMEAEQTVYDYKLIEIPQQLVHHLAVSSTKIRNYLAEGKVKLADELLGYPYFFSAEVIKGDKRGRQIGYPTANLSLLNDKKIIPGKGVYAVKVIINDAALGGMMNIGFRPTFGGKKLSLEVHLFDFDKDIYDKIITVHFIDFIRQEIKFEGIDQLVRQLKKDEKDALRMLK